MHSGIPDSTAHVLFKALCFKKSLAYDKDKIDWEVLLDVSVSFTPHIQTFWLCLHTYI